MSFNTYTPPGWWERTRFMRYAFAAGTVFGIGVGWFFHSIISMVFQFGVVVLLLLPLVLLAFMWWRSSRERHRLQSSMTVVRWGGGQFPRYGNDVAADQYGRVGLNREDVVDLDDIRSRERHH